MAYLDQPRVQAYLEPTKAPIASIDVALEEASVDYVLARLTQYDVSGWTAESTTPRLVLELAAMRYAGIYYNRAYSEEAINPGGWGNWLLKQVETMVDDITSGATDIPGVDPVVSNRGPSFYPTDAQEFDGLGSEIKFSMGMQF